MELKRREGTAVSVKTGNAQPGTAVRVHLRALLLALSFHRHGCAMALHGKGGSGDQGLPDRGSLFLYQNPVQRFLVPQVSQDLCSAFVTFLPLGCWYLCLEMAKPGFELRLAGSKPLCSFCCAALCATPPPPQGVVQGCAPVSTLYRAPQQIFVGYTFEKTPNTEAIVAPKPGLCEKELHPLLGCQLSIPVVKAVCRKAT